MSLACEGTRPRRPARLAGVAAATRISTGCKATTVSDPDLIEAIQLSLVAEYSKGEKEPSVLKEESSNTEHPEARHATVAKEDARKTPEKPRNSPAKRASITRSPKNKSPMSASRERTTRRPIDHKKAKEGHASPCKTPLDTPSESPIKPCGYNSTPVIRLSDASEASAVAESSPSRASGKACSPVHTSGVGISDIHEQTTVVGDTCTSSMLADDSTIFEPLKPVTAHKAPMVTPTLPKARPSVHSDIKLSVDSVSSFTPTPQIPQRSIASMSNMADSIDSFTSQPETPGARAGAEPCGVAPRVLSFTSVSPDSFRIMVSQKQANARAIEDRFFCMADMGASSVGVDGADSAESSRQSTASECDNLEALVFGVADGHGGDDVAKHVSTILPPNILRLTRAANDVLSVQAAIVQAFRACDDAWLRSVPKAVRPDPAIQAKCKVGACVVAVLIKRMAGSWVMFTANCGDSRAVLGRCPAAVDRSRQVAVPGSKRLRSPEVLNSSVFQQKRRRGEAGTSFVTTVEPSSEYSNTVVALVEKRGPLAERVGAKIVRGDHDTCCRAVDLIAPAEFPSIMGRRFQAVLQDGLEAFPLSADMKSSSLSEIRNLLCRFNTSRDPHPIRFFAKPPTSLSEEPGSMDRMLWELALQESLKNVVHRRSSPAVLPGSPLTNSSQTYRSSKPSQPTSGPQVQSPRRRQEILERCDIITRALLAEDPCKAVFGACFQPRVAGSLAVTRAMGDAYLKDPDRSFPPFASGCPYITCEPHIVTHHLSPADKFVVVGSDGLWDFAENEAIVAMAAVAIEDEILERIDAGIFDAKTSANMVGRDVSAFAPYSSRVPAAPPRNGPTLERSLSASSTRLPTTLATDVLTAEDCVAGDPAQRLVGYSLCELINASKRMKNTNPDLSSLPAILSAPLARRRRLHDDVTSLIMLLPTELFACKTPARFPRQRHPASATPGDSSTESRMHRQGAALAGIATPVAFPCKTPASQSVFQSARIAATTPLQRSLSTATTTVNPGATTAASKTLITQYFDTAQ